MKVRIDIDTKTFVRFGLVIIGFVLAALLVYRAQTGLIIVGTAFFLALALSVPVALIAKRLPGKSRVGATALAYIAVIGILASLVMFVIPPIVQQTARFIQAVPDMVDQVTTQWTALDHLIDQYDLRDQVDAAMTGVKDNASQWAANVGQGVITSIGSIFSFIAAAFLVLVLTFLMLVEGPTWTRRWFTLYRDQDRMERHKRLINKMYHVVTGYVTGQLTVSTIGALSAAAAVFILSFIFPVPTNLTLPTLAIAFLFSLIPMFGSTIGGVLVGILLAFNSFPAALIFAVFFIVYQQIENNFIAPHIQAKKIDLSALIVLVAITIGIYMFGLVGGIIAIPIAGCIKVSVEEYIVYARTKRKESATPLARLAKKLQGE